MSSIIQPPPPSGDGGRTTGEPTRHVRVGVGVLVRDPGDPTKVFAGLRKNSHGAGTLALPGGHLEMGESWSDCAVREVREETGLIVDPATVRFVHVTNDPMMDEGKHYVTIFMGGDCCSSDVDADGGGGNAVPRTLEPDKCEGWRSYGWTDLADALASSRAPTGNPDDFDGGPSVRLFGPLRRLVEERPPALLAFLGVAATEGWT